MKNILITTFILLAAVSLSFAFGLSFRDDGTVDVQIVAVVGDKPILSSELDQTVLAMGYPLPKDSTKFYKLYADVLNDLINEKLIYQAALAESLEVDDQTVQSEFSARWDTLTAQYGSEAKLADTLAKEGLTLSEFKYKVKEQVRTGLLKQMFIQKHIGFVEVSDEDVEKFFQQNKDSLGEYPAQAHLYAILVAPPSDSVLQNDTQMRALNAIAELKRGKNFETLAKEISEDPATKSLGGKIGEFAIGDLPKNFQNAISKLKVGEFSQPIKGEEGYHILKLLSRKGDKVEIAHIFFKTPSAQDGAHEIANAIYDSISAGGDFSEFVKKYSADSASAAAGGEVGWYPLSSVEQIISAVDTTFDKALQSGANNETRLFDKTLPPVPEQNGWAIYRITGIKAAEPLNLETHGDIIREMARKDAFSKKLKKTLKNLRKQIFVEIRNEKIKSFMNK